MAGAKFSWHGDRVLRGHLVPLVRGRMERANNVFVAQVQQRISQPYPPASRPGQPPRRRTGRLASSVKGEVRQDGGGITATTKATARYAGFLQLGTVHLDPRPFLYMMRSQAMMFVRAIGR